MRRIRTVVASLTAAAGLIGAVAAPTFEAAGLRKWEEAAEGS